MLKHASKCHRKTPRDNWAKILLRMKGNIPEVCLRERRHSQQQTEKIYKKAPDRLKERAEKKRGRENT